MMKDLLSTLKFKTAVIHKSSVIAAYRGCDCGFVPPASPSIAQNYITKLKNEI